MSSHRPEALPEGQMDPRDLEEDGEKVDDLEEFSQDPQPPFDWPQGWTPERKSKMSPLRWPFTDKQNQRKLKWLEALRGYDDDDLPGPVFAASKLINLGVVRRNWVNPSRKPNRIMKFKDLHFMVHPDKAQDFKNNTKERFGMDFGEIEKLHREVYNS